MPDVNYMKQLAEQFEKGELKILGDEEHFEFACDQCGKCCRNRSDIILNPLDIFHLKLATGKTCKEVVDKYGECYLGPSSHLPLVRLRYREELDGQTTCYFLGRRDGKFFCRVHEHKPGVCRTYPLGKITAAAKDGGDPLLAPSFFLQEEDGTYCAGLKRAHAEHVKRSLIGWADRSARESAISMGISSRNLPRLTVNSSISTSVLNGWTRYLNPSLWGRLVRCCIWNMTTARPMMSFWSDSGL